MKNDYFYQKMVDDVDVKQPIVDENQIEGNPNQSPKPKIDISNSVEKKTRDDGEISLYYQSEKIGQILQKGPGYLYEMADGYEFNNEKFYKGEKQKKRDHPESYVEGCDMGWC